jgi:hypothetical protein
MSNDYYWCQSRSVMASVTVCGGGGGVVGAIFYPIYFNTSFQVVFHKTEIP